MEYKFPIRIGITGHRSLTGEEWEHVIAELHKSINWIRDKVDKQRRELGIKAEYYISGITPLAEGVDRLFADEVLKQGGKLEAILPFRKEIYEKDFQDNISVSEFNRLLSYDRSPIIIDVRDAPNKEWSYYHTGKLLVDQCDILIGVWNGNDAKGAGGTQNIIQYAKENKVPTIIIHLDKNKKTEHSNTANIDFTAYLQFSKQWYKLGNNIREGRIAKPPFGSLAVKIGREEAGKMATLFDAYSIWDYAAIMHQKTHKRLVSFLYLFAAIASLIGIFTILYDTLLHTAGNSGDNISWHEIVTHCFEAFALVAVILWYSYIKNASKHKKWVQCRIWAEKIRLLVFQISCTKRKNERMDENIDMPLYENKNWYSRVYLSLAKEFVRETSARLEFNERVDILRELLVKEQIVYHKNKLETNEGFTRNLRRISSIFLGIAFSCVVLEIFLDIFNKGIRAGALGPFHLVFGVIIVLIPVFWGVLEGYKSIVDHEKAIAINKTMMLRFKSILNDLDNFCSNEDELLTVFEKIGSLMQFENNEWIFLIKDPEPVL